MWSNHLILCCLLLLPPSIFPSIKVFSNESVLRIRWPKYWSFSLNICPSSEHPGLISFRMDWLNPLAVQGTLKSLLQHHSSKASILQHSAFFRVQLSHPYMTTGKTIALIRRTFVGKGQYVGRLSHFSRVWLFVTPGTVAHQAPLSMGLSRQEYWSGLPHPPPRDLPNIGIELHLLCLLHWQVGSLPLAPPDRELFIITKYWSNEGSTRRSKQHLAANLRAEIRNRCSQAKGYDQWQSGSLWGHTSAPAASLYLELPGTYLPGIQRRWFIGSCLTRGSLLTKYLRRFSEKLWPSRSCWHAGVGAAVPASGACAAEAVHIKGTGCWGRSLNELVLQNP